MSVNADQILAGIHKNKPSIEVERPDDAPITLDLALLSSYDPNCPGETEKIKTKTDIEDILQAHCRDGVQFLLNSVFKLPTKQSDDGPIAQLPAVEPGTLPREKPLPKSKPKTKWERFAEKKGIKKRGKKDRLVFDEASQEWVPRWGYKGKNKEKEEEWLTPITTGKDADYDPRAEARKKRKANIMKNEAQRLRNISRNAGTQDTKSSSSSNTRTDELTKALSITRKSTASMGKFDKSLPGDEKLNKGQRRKFEDNLASDSRKRDLAIANSVAKGKTSKQGDVNVRKAISSVSKGGGAAALAGDDEREKKRKR